MAADFNTIEEVLAALKVVCDEACEANDRTGFFAALYRQVTLEIAKAIGNGQFEDGPRMSRFDAHFGSRYFQAFDAYRQPSAAVPVPQCWQVAFDTCTSHAAVVQHLVLGINAHINLDLAGAAADTSPDDIESLHADYLKVNAILSGTLDKVQDELDTISPLLWMVDRLGWGFDEHVLSWIVRSSRDEAWQSAVVLAPLSADERVSLTESLDRTATELAHYVCHLPPGLEPVLRFHEQRDVASVIKAIERAGATDENPAPGAAARRPPPAGHVALSPPA
jgi:Family of unknown function (DUF5995)